MKLIVAGIAVLAIGTVSATAADLSAKAPVYKAAPMMVDPWAGFYVGANLGYSWGDWRSDSNQAVFNFEQFTARPKVDGILGGVQAGFNWRAAAQWIFGIEADIQATDEKARQVWTDPGLPPNVNVIINDFVPRPGGPATLNHQWSFPWFGTVRLRAGYNPTPDWLLFVTGGLAYGESRYGFDFSQPGAAANQVGSNATTYALRRNSTDVGYAVGVGAEYKISRNWSVKGEYLYVDLGKRTIVTTDIDGAPFRVGYNVNDHIVRVGINYGFNWSAPVIAKY